MSRITHHVSHLWWGLIRFGFRLLYNELAWTYDLVSWVVSLGQWRRWQQAGLPFLTGRRILEIAHGTGHMLLAMKTVGLEVVGFDLSPAMGRIASGRLRRAGIIVPLVRGRAQSLPFAPESFDSALSTFPTDFLLMPETLAAVYQALRPGGRYVIVIAGFMAGSGPLVRFLEWLYRITGQRGGRDTESSLLEESPLWQRAQRQFAAAGFVTRLEQVRLASSQALVIVAEKPTSP